MVTQFCFPILIVVYDDSQLRPDDWQTRDPSINPNLSEDWIGGVADIGGIDSDNDNELQKFLDTPDELLPRKRPLSPDSSSMNKSRRTSAQQSAAKLAKEGMQDLGECMKAAMVRAAELPSITRFDQCLPLLSQMREKGELSKENYLQYSRLLRSDEKLAAMFVGMDEDLRVEWLEMELEFAAS